MRKSVSRKILKKLIKKIETFTKKDSIFITEITSCKRGMLKQIILTLLAVIIKTLIESIIFIVILLSMIAIS